MSGHWWSIQAICRRVWLKRETNHLNNISGLTWLNLRPILILDPHILKRHTGKVENHADWFTKSTNIKVAEFVLCLARIHLRFRLDSTKNGLLFEGKAFGHPAQQRAWSQPASAEVVSACQWSAICGHSFGGMWRLLREETMNGNGPSSRRQWVLSFGLLQRFKIHNQFWVSQVNWGFLTRRIIKIYQKSKPKLQKWKMKATMNKNF